MSKKKLNDVIWIRNKSNYIDSSNENLDKVKDLLGETGKGFCLAKFTQVTMHLGTGMTHSCHHPSPHKIPLEEIEKNPAALFNTNRLKKARREMFENERPSECDYCWRVEDTNGYSDRFFKSLEPWALNEHDRIVNTDPEDNIVPTYLEVDFSNVCNFACTYCGPEYSSKWVENLKQHGPIKLLDNTKYSQWSHGWQDLDSLTYKSSEFNPYVDAFWKWFPEVYKQLKVYRITGGEPLLSKETFRSIDWFIDNPNPELEFSINSNLGAPQKLWDQFIEKIQILTNNKCVKRFTVFTSVDGWGERAEYARPGLNFELFKTRYEQLLKIGNIRATIMCTYNIFSVTSMKQLLEWQANLKSIYNPDMALIDLEEQFGYRLADGDYTQRQRKERCQNHHGLVGLDVPYLRSPGFLDAHYIDKNLIQDYMIPSFNYMIRFASGNVNGMGLHQGFEDYEIEKFKRIVIEAMNFNKIHEEDHETILLHRARFFDFVNEIDKRHNRNFVKTFPEMAEFYNKCKMAKEKLIPN